MKTANRAAASALGRAAFAAVMLAAGSAAAQDTGAMLKGGTIGEAQVTHGKELFQTTCSGCHGSDLRSVNTNAPDLTGPAFDYAWSSRPLAETFEAIHTKMPPGDPGGLPLEDYAAITAYILAFNGVEPSADGELPADEGGMEGMTVVTE